MTKPYEKGELTGVDHIDWIKWRREYQIGFLASPDWALDSSTDSDKVVLLN